jgi:hypothetical protein
VAPPRPVHPAARHPPRSHFRRRAPRRVSRTARLASLLRSSAAPAAALRPWRRPARPTRLPQLSAALPPPARHRSSPCPRVVAASAVPPVAAQPLLRDPASTRACSCPPAPVALLARLAVGPPVPAVALVLG